MATTLTLFVGNTKPFDIVIGSSLDGADRASFTMKDYIGGSTLLQRDTQAGNMTIDGTNKKLTSTITGVEADALTPGKYVAQAGVRFGSLNDWQFTDHFYVEVKAAIVAKV